jgi:hypothetical protein
MPYLNRKGANVKLARKCLGLIRDIADWGASSSDLSNVGYALQELSQVLLERTGTQDRFFEPIPASEIENLDALYKELEFAGHMVPGPVYKVRISLGAGEHGAESNQKSPPRPEPGGPGREALDATG